MKIISRLFVIVLALIVELVVLEFGGEVLFGRSHGMMADARFRHQERIAAFFDYHDHPSQATKATFDEEMRLMHRHEDWKVYLWLSILFTVNAAGIYYYWNYEDRKTLA